MSNIYTNTIRDRRYADLLIRNNYIFICFDHHEICDSETSQHDLAQFYLRKIAFYWKTYSVFVCYSDVYQFYCSFSKLNNFIYICLKFINNAWQLIEISMKKHLNEIVQALTWSDSLQFCFNCWFFALFIHLSDFIFVHIIFGTFALFFVVFLHIHLFSFASLRFSPCNVVKMNF